MTFVPFLFGGVLTILAIAVGWLLAQHDRTTKKIDRIASVLGRFGPEMQRRLVDEGSHVHMPELWVDGEDLE